MLSSTCFEYNKTARTSLPEDENSVARNMSKTI